MRCYAGIGSRRTPDDILKLITRIARLQAAEGWTLRTGHAIGADQAFELGAGDKAQVFLPWKDYEEDAPTWGEVHIMPSVKALQLVEKYHPAPERLSMAATRLHARNCHILLGAGLDDPVEHVVCFTANQGGTTFGLRIAAEYRIPIFNLAYPQVRYVYEAILGDRLPL